MALSDVYQLIVKQSLFSKECENVFFFEKLDPAGTADDLITAFMATLSAPIRALQATAVVWRLISAASLGDLSDFGEVPQTVAGTYGNVDVLPAFNALSYTFHPATRAVRPGGKRIAGVPEAASLNGVITDPTYITLMESLRIFFDDALVGAAATYQPVIVKRIKTAVAGTTPVKYKYALPKAGDTLVLGLVKSASDSLNVSSQVSRKD